MTDIESCTDRFLSPPADHGLASQEVGEAETVAPGVFSLSCINTLSIDSRQ